MQMQICQYPQYVLQQIPPNYPDNCLPDFWEVPQNWPVIKDVTEEILPELLLVVESHGVPVQDGDSEPLTRVFHGKGRGQFRGVAVLAL